MKLLIVVGARPNFVKIAPLIRAIHQSPVTIHHLLVHTGQHYDFEMSQIFFQDLKIPKPDYSLGVGSGSHAWQTAKIMEKLEPVFLKEKPDLIIVVGDVNSTLAGALVAAKLRCSQSPITNHQLPLIVHIEAGLRSFDMSMPEEINRRLTDHISDFLFCPTKTAVANLKREGFKNIINDGELTDFSSTQSPITNHQLPTVINVGDIMYDAFLKNIKIAQKKSKILKELNLKPKSYLLLTLHRPQNVDNPENLKKILEAINKVGEKVIFLVHPRTRKQIKKFNLQFTTYNLQLISPVGYLDMLWLEKNAKKILTDSGGVQKESYWCKVPCITLREETEWVETVEAGWNVLVGCDPERIVRAIGEAKPGSTGEMPYGDGRAAERIVGFIGFVE